MRGSGSLGCHGSVEADHVLVEGHGFGDRLGWVHRGDLQRRALLLGFVDTLQSTERGCGTFGTSFFTVFRAHSSPGGGSSGRIVGGVVGVTPRLSGRSSPGGGSSLGGTSSALVRGPGGTTSSSSTTTISSSGGTASTTPSSGAGVVVEAVSSSSSVALLLLRSSQNESEISMIKIRMPIPSPTAALL